MIPRVDNASSDMLALGGSLIGTGGLLDVDGKLLVGSGVTSVRGGSRKDDVVQRTNLTWEVCFTVAIVVRCPYLRDTGAGK